MWGREKPQGRHATYRKAVGLGEFEDLKEQTVPQYVVYGEAGDEQAEVSRVEVPLSQSHPPAELTDSIAVVRYEVYGDGSSILTVVGYDQLRARDQWLAFATALDGLSIMPIVVPEPDLLCREVPPDEAFAPPDEHLTGRIQIASPPLTQSPRTPPEGLVICTHCGGELTMSEVRFEHGDQRIEEWVHLTGQQECPAIGQAVVRIATPVRYVERTRTPTAGIPIPPSETEVIPVQDYDDPARPS